MDAGGELKGEVLAPTKDPDYIAWAAVEGGTVAWPNGTDFAPEFLYHDAMTVASA